MRKYNIYKKLLYYTKKNKLYKKKRYGGEGDKEKYNHLTQNNIKEREQELIELRKILRQPGQNQTQKDLYEMERIKQIEKELKELKELYPESLKSSKTEKNTVSPNLWFEDIYKKKSLSNNSNSLNNSKKSNNPLLIHKIKEEMKKGNERIRLNLKKRQDEEDKIERQRWRKTERKNATKKNTHKTLRQNKIKTQREQENINQNKKIYATLQKQEEDNIQQRIQEMKKGTERIKFNLKKRQDDEKKQILEEKIKQLGIESNKLTQARLKEEAEDLNNYQLQNNINKSSYDDDDNDDYGVWRNVNSNNDNNNNDNNNSIKQHNLNKSNTIKKIDKPMRFFGFSSRIPHGGKKN